MLKTNPFYKNVDKLMVKKKSGSRGIVRIWAPKVNYIEGGAGRNMS